MKRKIPILIALAILTIVALLTACSPRQTEKQLEQFEDQVENRLDAAEDAISDAVQEAISTITTAPNTPLTAEDAKAIAVEHAGLIGQQVSRLRAEYEIDDGIPQYDVEFYHDGIEYNYEIHAETGKILSFDKDRD